MSHESTAQVTEAPAPARTPPVAAAGRDFNPLVSYFPDAYENLPTDIPAAQFIADIQGGQHRKLVAQIRERFQRALQRGVEYSRAKRVVDTQKKRLPAAAIAGMLPIRDKTITPQFTGLVQADLDLLGDRLLEIRATLRDDPHVYAVFVSPTGEGLKALYRVPICQIADEYKMAFAAVSVRVQDLTGVVIDRLEDFTRLCFASHDPEAYLNQNAIELSVDFRQPAEEADGGMNPVAGGSQSAAAWATAASPSRRAIAETIIGPVDWLSEILGDCRCPGAKEHTTGEKPHECRIHLDKVPTIHCVHKSCASAVEAANHRLRSAIGKTERPAAPRSSRADIAREYLGGKNEAAPEMAWPEPIDATKFLATPMEMPAQLVEGLLDRGCKFALGGASKSKKTWVLADLAISLATGTPWLGCRTNQGKVLFLNFEIREAHWQWRLKQVAQAKGVELDPGQLVLLNLRGFAANFRSLIPKIIEFARSQGFDLIIFDPVYKIYGTGADENSAGDMAGLMNGLEEVAVQTGAAIAYGAHFSKGNQSQKNAIDRISGSGVYGRDPDALLIFTEHDEPDALAVEAILRDFPPIEPFVVRWKFPLMYRDDDLDPAKLKQVGGRKKAYDPTKLLALIAYNDSANPITISAWARLADMPRKTLTDYLPEMRGNQWIETIGEGNASKQAITNAGKAFLQQSQSAESNSPQVS